LEVIQTRLRFISSKTVEELTQAVDSLPFKVELKSLVYDPIKKRWFQTFVIPDEINFKNLEL